MSGQVEVRVKKGKIINLECYCVRKVRLQAKTQKHQATLSSGSLPKCLSTLTLLGIGIKRTIMNTILHSFDFQDLSLN